MRLPKYLHHRRSNRATIQFKPLYGDRPRYLPGAFNSDESKSAYQECCKEIVAFKLGRGASLTKPPADCSVTVLIQHFLVWADGYYPKRGTRGEYKNLVGALRPLRALYGKSNVSKFGPLALKAVQQAMVDRGWARKHINSQVHRVRRCFRWAVENEMVSGELYQRLLAVSPLRMGSVRDTADVAPVPRAAIDAVLPFLSQVVRTMVELHWLTGMRCDELTGMRADEIDRSKSVWFYCPLQHKTATIGKLKAVPIGPLAQKLLQPYLSNRPYFFAPMRRRGAKPRYDSESYYHAILLGFMKLLRSKGFQGDKPKGISWRKFVESHGVAYWHPYQIRHSRATLTREKYGREGSEAQLGNTKEATDIYALPSLPLAVKIAVETG